MPAVATSGLARRRPSALQRLEGEAVGEQEDVGARGAGGDLGAQARHDLAGAAADPLDLHAGVPAAEGLDRAGGVGFELGGVEHELAGHVLRGGGTDPRRRQPRHAEPEFTPPHLRVPPVVRLRADLPASAGFGQGGDVKNR